LRTIGRTARSADRADTGAYGEVSAEDWTALNVIAAIVLVRLGDCRARAPRKSNQKGHMKRKLRSLPINKQGGRARTAHRLRASLPVEKVAA
jgi:hypothetical protein